MLNSTRLYFIPSLSKNSRKFGPNNIILIVQRLQGKQYRTRRGSSFCKQLLFANSTILIWGLSGKGTITLTDYEVTIFKTNLVIQFDKDI